MARIGSTGLAVVLATALVSGGFLAASAQEPAPAALPPGQSQITVVKRPYDTGKLLAAEAAVPADVYRGRTVWLQRCAYCHDGVGQPSYHTLGPWLGAETVQMLSESGMRQFIAAGTTRMPGFRYALTPAQVNDVIAFLKTVSSDQKPTAAQLAGGEAAPPHSD